MPLATYTDPALAEAPPYPPPPPPEPAPAPVEGTVYGSTAGGDVAPSPPPPPTATYGTGTPEERRAAYEASNPDQSVNVVHTDQYVDPNAPGSVLGDASRTASPPPPAAAPSGTPQSGTVYGSTADTTVAPSGTTAPPEQPVPTLEQAGANVINALGGVKDAALSGNIGNVPSALGNVKDQFGGATQAMGGDIFPWRRMESNYIIDAALTVQPGQEGASVGDQFLDVNPLANYARSEEGRRAYEEGFTDPGTGTTFQPGPQAVWESWVNSKPWYERAMLDLAYDPTTLTAAVPAIEGASKAGKIPGIVGKGARLVDDVTSLGTGRIIEGGLDAAGAGLKKVGLLAPTNTQAAKTAGEEAATAGEILGAARRGEGQLDQVTLTEPAPGFVTLEHPSGLLPSVTYKTDGRVIQGVVPDPTNLTKVVPVTQVDHANIVNLASRLSPDDQLKLMNTGLRSLELPAATIARPYTQVLQRSLPARPGTPLRGTIPVPASGPDLLALRGALRGAVTAGDPATTRELVLAAQRSGLLPAGTPPTARGVTAAIGAIESARNGAPLIDPATLTAVEGVLRHRLDQQGLTDVGIALDRVIQNAVTGTSMPGVEGQYFNKVIGLATDLTNTDDPRELALRLGDVMNHEVIHATRHFGLYRDTEWRSLERMTEVYGAAGDNMSFLDEVTARYTDAASKGAIPTPPSPDQLREEAVAELYRAYASGKLTKLTPVQTTLLDKLTHFFRAVVDTLRGSRGDAVLGRIESGEIGRRARGASPVMSTPLPALVRQDPVLTLRPQGKIPEPVPVSPVDVAGVNPRYFRENLDAMMQLGRGPGVGNLGPEEMRLLDEELQAAFRAADQRYGGILTELMRPGKPLEKMQIPDAARWDRALKQDWRDILWYEDSARSFGTHMQMPTGETNAFYNVLAATSANTEPKFNLDRAVSTFAESMQGKPVLTPGTSPEKVAEALRSMHMSSPKFYNFSNTPKYMNALIDTPPGPTLDLQFARGIGLESNAAFEGDVYNALSDYVVRTRNILNSRIGNQIPAPLETWNLQAALWVDQRIASGVDDIGSAYSHYLDDVVQRLSDLGAPLSPEGKIIPETFMHPDIPRVFGQTAENVRTGKSMQITMGSPQPVQEARRIAGMQGATKEARDEFRTGVMNPFIKDLNVDKGPVMPQLYKALSGTQWQGRAMETGVKIGNPDGTVGDVISFNLTGRSQGAQGWTPGPEGSRFAATALLHKFNLERADVVRYVDPYMDRLMDNESRTYQLFLPEHAQETTDEWLQQAAREFGVPVRAGNVKTGGYLITLEAPPGTVLDPNRVEQSVHRLYPGDTRVEMREYIRQEDRYTQADYPKARMDFELGIREQARSENPTEAKRAAARADALAAFDTASDNLRRQWESNASGYVAAQQSKLDRRLDAEVKRHVESARKLQAAVKTAKARGGMVNVGERAIGQEGLPVDTPLGPMFSVVKENQYHGSERAGLQVLKASMPLEDRRFPWGSSMMGAYTTPSLRAAQGYANPARAAGYPSMRPGSLYVAKLDLDNAYEMAQRDFERFYTDDPQTLTDALRFKYDLMDQGHDGIVVMGYLDPTGKYPSYTPGINEEALYQPVEVVSFKDVPIMREMKYALPKGQSGVIPTRPGAPVVPGVYRRGSVDEYLGTLVADADREVLDREYSFGGQTEKVWQTYTRHQDTIDNARRIAQKSVGGAVLSSGERQTLDRVINDLKRYPELDGLTERDLAGWTDEAVDRTASRKTAHFLDQAQGLRDASGKEIEPGYYKGLAGSLLKKYDNFGNFRRTMSLYSTTRGPAYVLMQAIGNALTLAIAKPSALNYYTPMQWNELRKAGSETLGAAEPWVFRLRDDVGLGSTSRLLGSRDQLNSTKTFFAKGEGARSWVGKLIAPQWVKNWADSWDRNLRAAVWRSVFEPGYASLRKQLPDSVGRALAEAGARSGFPSSVSRAQFVAAVDGLGERFSGAQLRKALFDAAGNDAVAKNAAERVARDYTNQVRQLDRTALDEVDRIGFTFDDTRADAVLSRLVMFHYWLSRASVLYLREAARNPYQMQLWVRAMNESNRQVERGVPSWQKDMMEFMQTPAGVTGLFSPAYLLGTYLFFQEGGEPSPLADLTQVGDVIEKSFIKNMMLNPLIQGAIYVTGMGGRDFSPPDLLGSGKWTGDLNVWLDKANKDVAAFYATEKGNPKQIPNIDGRQLLGWVAEQITQKGWQNDFFGMAPIKGYDPSASEQANLAYTIRDAILADHPELSDGSQRSAETLASLVEEALSNPDSDYYQKGYQTVVDAAMAGPGSGRDNAFLDVGAYMGRLFLPFGVQTQITSRRERQIRSNLDQKTAEDTEMGYIDDATPEKRAFDLGYDQVRAAWSPAATQIRNIYSGIKSGQLPDGMDSITIDGVTWTSDSLATLPSADRATLAQYWMTFPHAELGGKTGWDIQGEAYDAEAAALEDHPDVADYRALGDYAAAYPGGPLEFIRDTAAINANYRRFVEQLPTDFTEADFVKEATSVPAFAALTGVKYSTYGSNPMPEGKGQVAGLAPGTSLGEWQVQQREEGATDGTSSRKEQLDAELSNYGRVEKYLVSVDPSGELANRYANNLANGYHYLDDDLYATLSNAGFSDDEMLPQVYNEKTGKTSNQVGWYLKWALANGVQPGQGVDEYWTQNNRDYLGKKVADINAGIYSAPTEEDLQATQSAAAATTPSSIEKVGNILPAKPAQWWQPIGNALGSVATTFSNFMEGHGAVFGASMVGSGDQVSKPAQTSGMAALTAPGYYDVVPANDGKGLQSTIASDRTWMEDMLGGHAQVTTEYKGPRPSNCLDCYTYQIGHNADELTHAAYDISCDDPNGQCWGTPVMAPLAGTVTCAGHGNGQSTMPDATCYYSVYQTSPNPDGTPAAHDIFLDVGTDAAGNDIQLTFSHMGTSNVQPGQQITPGTLLGGMGDTPGGPHIHLQALAYDPQLGTYVFLDPQLVVGGFYQTHDIYGNELMAAPQPAPAAAPAPQGGGSIGDALGGMAQGAIQGVQSLFGGGAPPPPAPAPAPEPAAYTGAMPAVGGDWSVLDQYNDAYPSASQQVQQETGITVPPELIKAVNAMESGYGKVNPPTGQRELRGQQYAGFVGIFQDSADSYGLDFTRVASDPNYAIYGLATGLATIAQWDSGSYPSGTPGVSVLDQYGWDGVLSIYYSGNPDKTGWMDEAQTVTAADYVNNVNQLALEAAGR